MKKLLSGLLLLCWTVSASAAAVTADLTREMGQTKSSDKIRINIVMQKQYDQKDLMQAAGKSSRAIKREIVKAELKAFSSQTQSGILNQLSTLENSKSVSNVKPLWIANVISCEATPQAIAELTKRDDVESIDFDEFRNLLSNEPKQTEKEIESPATSQTKDGKEITTNITKVQADQVWAQGYTGQGVLVSVIDTGVNYNHVDLKDHMWDGGTAYPNHGYDFVNTDNNPMDDHGHGTHCAGTVAGDGTGASKTGAAPDATIMALKILNSNGGGTESGVWQAIQFAIDHQADVFSMSIGWQPSYNPDRKTWRNTMNNALAAGVIAVVAAANSGSDASSSYTPTSPNPSSGGSAVPWNVGTPGDCPPPWLHPDQSLTGGLSAVLSVGASNLDETIAYFSSRGPVPWNERVVDYTDYAYTAGSTTNIGLIRPDIVAPGVDIKSCLNTSNTGYQTMSGTSMATPLTAGVVALMISKKPAITPAEICRIIQETAANKPVKKNNTFGAGRVDALAAVAAVSAVPIPVDAAINAITSPVSGANLTASETVTVVIKNSGTEAISSGLTLSFQVDTQSEVTQNYTGAAIQPGATVNFSFTQKANLAAGGIHSVKVSALIANDGNLYNNSRTVQVTNAVPFNIPFVETFESTTFPPFGWTINNPDGGKTWERKAANGNGSSANAAYVNFFSYSGAVGAKDEMISPVISLINVASCDLTFNVAYRQYANETDGLKIYLSTNAGSSFNTTPIYDKSGPALATTTLSTSQFTPNAAAQWRLETISLNSFVGNNIALKFESINAYGNNMFVDDIKVSGTSGIEEDLLASKTVLEQNYPNPFNPVTSISYELAAANLIRLTVYNSKGELVKTLFNGMQNAGKHSVEFDGAGLNSGVYFYKLTTSEKSFVSKMVLTK